VGKYKKRPTMRVMLTRIDGGACGEGSSVPMPWRLAFALIQSFAIFQQAPAFRAP
jgi:hypothetical protein